MDQVYAHLFERLARADPGEEQELWRVDCAATQDHLARGGRLVPAAVEAVGDADRAACVANDACCLRVRREPSGWAVATPVASSRRRRSSAVRAAARRTLRAPSSVPFRSGERRCPRLGCGHERLRQQAGVAERRARKARLAAPVGVLDVHGGPAERAPLLLVEPVAAEHHLRVDRRRPAERLTSRGRRSRARRAAPAGSVRYDQSTADP